MITIVMQVNNHIYQSSKDTTRITVHSRGRANTDTVRQDFAARTRVLDQLLQVATQTVEHNFHVTNITNKYSSVNGSPDSGEWSKATLAIDTLDYSC